MSSYSVVASLGSTGSSGGHVTVFSQLGPCIEISLPVAPKLSQKIHLMQTRSKSKFYKPITNAAIVYGDYVDLQNHEHSVHQALNSLTR